MNATTANIILSHYNGHSETIALDIAENSKVLNLSTFTTGLCNVSLQIDGQIADTKTLLIQ